MAEDIAEAKHDGVCGFSKIANFACALAMEGSNVTLLSTDVEAVFWFPATSLALPAPMLAVTVPQPVEPEMAML